MTLKNDAKFEEKLSCGLENDMRNMTNFHQSTKLRRSQNGTLVESFYLKQNMYELKFN